MVYILQANSAFYSTQMHTTMYTSTYICKESHSKGPQQSLSTKVRRIKGKHYILGLIEAGLSCSCLEQLGWFAGRNPKDCTVGHVTENPPVPCTLGLGGWWRSERSKFLSLDGRRWGCLNLWLLSYWGLNLLERDVKRVPKKKKKRWKEKQINRQAYNKKCHVELTWDSNGCLPIIPRGKE